MPIRKRITDPYSAETKEVERRRKYGKPPTAPRKPSAEERKPFYDCLLAIPVGKTHTNAVWRDVWILPLMKRTFSLWGVDLAMYPIAKRDSLNRDLCTGVQLRMLKKGRTGMFPTLTLIGEDKSGWYGRVLRWIEDQCYGG